MELTLPDKPGEGLRTVRKTSLRWFYYSLGRALPFLAHLPAKGLGTLWNPVMSASPFFIYLSMVE